MSVLFNEDDIIQAGENTYSGVHISFVPQRSYHSESSHFLVQRPGFENAKIYIARFTSEDKSEEENTANLKNAILAAIPAMKHLSSSPAAA